MDTAPLKRWRGYLFIALGTVLVLGVLFVFSRTVENSAKYGNWQQVILVITVLGVLVLFGLLVRRVWLLIRDYRAHVPGSRLAARMVVIFSALTIVPLLVVYLFASLYPLAAVIAWLHIVFTGRTSGGIHNVLTVGLQYTLRTAAYFLLMTESFPPISDQAPAANQPPGAVTAGKAEGADSCRVRTMPRVPAQPVVSVFAADQIEVSWPKHPATDVAGYNVYRGLVSVRTVSKGEPKAWRDNDPEYPAPVPVARRPTYAMLLVQASTNCST